MRKFNISNLAAAFGNALEWYDFALYMFLAPIIAPLFFPENTPLLQLIEVYAVAAVGFLSRPLGGVIFGHIGDKFGRRRALIITVIGLSIPTFIFGLLPTYSSIGIFAPLILVILRLAQGIFIGGEFSGSMIYLVEQAPEGKKNLYGSFAYLFTTAGIFLASLTATAMHHWMSQAFLHTWGWRLGFLISPILGIIGYLLRCRMQESKEYKSALPKNNPLKAVFKTASRGMLIVFGLNIFIGVMFYIVMTFLSAYLSKILHYSAEWTLFLNTGCILILLLTLPLFGWLSDRLGKKYLLYVSCAFYAVASIPLFYVFTLHSTILTISTMLIFTLFIAMVQSSAPTLIVRQFPAEVRFTGFALSFNVSNALIAGTSPMFAFGLIQLTGNLIAPGYYLAASALIGLVALYYAK